MADPESGAERRPYEELFDLRQKLEGLTRQFVDNLLSSSEASESHASLLATILDSIADSLIVFDKDERIILANRAALETVGWDFQEMSREEFFSHYSFFKSDGKTPMTPGEEPYDLAKRDKRPAKSEGFVTGINLGPEGRWVSSHAAPVIDEEGEVFGVVTVFRDISERRRLQKQRDSLASLITHDLKNHLAGEALFLEVLRSELEGSLNAGDIELMTKLEQGNKQFMDISNTLLEIYRSDIYEVESVRGEVDPVELLESVLQLDRHVATIRQVELKSRKDEELPKIKGIASALRQVVHNLVQNAINVSPAGAEVELSVSAQPGAVLFEIKDQGPGMPQDMVEKLFEASHTANRFRSSATSTGFGLYLCRMLVEAQGGRIECESQEGKGSTFTVRLPVKDGSAS